MGVAAVQGRREGVVPDGQDRTRYRAAPSYWVTKEIAELVHTEIPPALVVRASTGDRDAFAELTRLTVRDLAGLALAVLGDHSSVDDVLQEAYLRAWTGLSRLREPARVQPWLRRLVVNVCLDERRRRRIPEVTAVQGRIVSPDHAPAVDQHVTLMRAFRTLSSEHRAVLALAYYRDLPGSAVAEILDIPVGTVKSRTHHALRELRAALAAQDRAIGHPLQSGGGDE